MLGQKLVLIWLVLLLLASGHRGSSRFPLGGLTFGPHVRPLIEPILARMSPVSIEMTPTVRALVVLV